MFSLGRLQPWPIITVVFEIICSRFMSVFIGGQTNRRSRTAFFSWLQKSIDESFRVLGGCHSGLLFFSVVRGFLIVAHPELCRSNIISSEVIIIIVLVGSRICVDGWVCVVE